MPPLDIVLLVLDTQRVDRLACYGHQIATSPHLDALAADATRFRYAVAPAQWTVPSHASMFTGVYPIQHGAVQSSSSLPPALPTVAERLRDAGYYTAAFCNNPVVGVVNNGLRRGFRSFLNYSGLLTSRPNQAGARSAPLDRYRQWFKQRVVALLNRVQDSFARSEALLAFSFTPLMVPLWQTALSFKGNTPKSLADAARLLIERRGLERDQPAFAFINLMGAHMPYHPPRHEVQRFAPDLLRSAAARRFLRRFNSDVLGWLAPLADELAPEQLTLLQGMYNAEVAAQDARVGAFVQQLRDHGALDRTLLVVCADHGEHLGEKHFIGHTVSLYNQLIHVPLLIRDPAGAFARGGAVDQVVSLRRLFHTMLTAAGAATPHERRFSLEHTGASDPDGGVALAMATPLTNVQSLLRQRQPKLVAKYRTDQLRRAVWRGRYKLIQTGDDGLELFDVVDDPTEQTNLRDMLPEQVDELRELGQATAGAAIAAPSQAPSTADEDPLVRHRLRDLGYLE
ncbi:MAG: sulfatase-like hydrolase/transferase [Chloroflexales bacterium]|nr:sulfatase-like hydrolase/transferase [Chloroflexales bacterium]